MRKVTKIQSGFTFFSSRIHRRFFDIIDPGDYCSMSRNISGGRRAERDALGYGDREAVHLQGLK